MAFDTSQNSYQALRSIIAERTDTVVAWVGSGISAPAGLPDWRGLRSFLEGALLRKAETLEEDDAKALKKIHEHIHRVTDVWGAFEALRENLGEATWKISIREALGTSATVPSPYGYRDIWKLRIHGMLSLNLDRLAAKSHIEVLGSGAPVEFSGIAAGNYVHVLRGPRRFICNLHGNTDDASSWVLTSSDLKRLLKDPAYRTFISTCLTSSTNVFFGMSVDDTAVNSLLMGLVGAGIDFGEHYWVTSRRDIATDKLAESIGVRLIRYNAPKNDHTELREALADLLSYVPPEDEAVDKPAFVGDCDVDESALPNPQAILQLETEQIRRLLNGRATEILSASDAEAYTKYEEFSKEYDEAIYRAWYTSTDPESNTLCGYELNREEAYGAFGKVFRAKDSEGNDVAIKVLHQEIRRDTNLLLSFRRGVRSMNILSNHGIEGMVPYRSASEIPAFVVMDWVGGPNLKAAVESKQIQDWETLLRIASNTATIVRRGHLLPERVLHRDLRPSNIMLADYWESPGDWRVVVLDFDLSWHRGSVEKSITHGSTLLGYLAPEQTQNIPGVSTRNTAVDSFGLGMTMFYMCSEHDPLPNEHLHVSWAESVAKAVHSPQECIWKSVPNRIERLITNATLQNQKERWDMPQIESELLRLLEAIRDPQSVQSAELVAEELAANCAFMEGYSWNEDDTAAVKETASSLRLVVSGNESDRAVKVHLTWGQPGVHGRGENVGKWIPQKTERAVEILAKGGWEVAEVGHKWARTEVEATIPVKRVVESLAQAIDTLDRATDQLRFA